MQKLVKITNHPKYSALDQNRDILKINHYFIMKKNQITISMQPEQKDLITSIQVRNRAKSYSMQRLIQLKSRNNLSLQNQFGCPVQFSCQKYIKKWHQVFFKIECMWGLTKSPFTIHEFNLCIFNLIRTLVSSSRPRIIQFLFGTMNLDSHVKNRNSFKEKKNNEKVHTN